MDVLEGKLLRSKRRSACAAWSHIGVEVVVATTSHIEIAVAVTIVSATTVVTAAVVALTIFATIIALLLLFALSALIFTLAFTVVVIRNLSKDLCLGDLGANGAMEFLSQVLLHVAMSHSALERGL